MGLVPLQKILQRNPLPIPPCEDTESTGFEPGRGPPQNATMLVPGCWTSNFQN